MQVSEETIKEARKYLPEFYWKLQKYLQNKTKKPRWLKTNTGLCLNFINFICSKRLDIFYASQAQKVLGFENPYPFDESPDDYYDDMDKFSNPKRVAYIMEQKTNETFHNTNESVRRVHKGNSF